MSDPRIRDLGPAREAGSSEGRLFEIYGQGYLAKTVLPRVNVWSTFHEFLAARIAQAMGLAIPPFRVVWYDKRPWFCSKWLTSARRPVYEDFARRGLLNGAQLATMAIFDILIALCDRDHSNMLCERFPDGSRRLLLIDHGMSLVHACHGYHYGPRGDRQVVSLAGRPLVMSIYGHGPDPRTEGFDWLQAAPPHRFVFPHLAMGVQSVGELEAGLAALDAAITEPNLTAWIEDTPAPWVIDPELLPPLRTFLVARRAAMPGLIAAVADPFFSNLPRADRALIVERWASPEDARPT